jgi:hypothetical protein
LGGGKDGREGWERRMGEKDGREGWERRMGEKDGREGWERCFPLPNPILYLGIPCALVKLME